MKINIYGLGAIGSNLLVQLAKQYPDVEFIGIDFDEVEERNIKTQAYFLEHVGMRKAQAMKVVLSRYLRKPKYTPVVMKVTAGYPRPVNHPETLCIDCFDNAASRQLLRVYDATGKGFDVDYLHLGFSPQYTAEFMWNKNYDVPNDTDPRANDICSMPDATSFIQYVVSLAGIEISRWIQTKEKRDFLVTGKSKIRWL